MSRLLCGTFTAPALVVACSLVSLPATFAGERANEDNKVEIVGEAAWPLAPRTKDAVGKGPMHQVIRSQEELIKATGWPGDGKTTEWLKSSGYEADFDKQMVLIVSGGAQATDGYRVEVTKVELDEKHKTMTVHWKLHTPEQGAAVSAVVTHPARWVLLKRFDGEVKFEPPAKPAQKPDKPKK